MSRHVEGHTRLESTRWPFILSLCPSLIFLDSNRITFSSFSRTLLGACLPFSPSLARWQTAQPFITYPISTSQARQLKHYHVRHCIWICWQLSLPSSHPKPKFTHVQLDYTMLTRPLFHIASIGRFMQSFAQGGLLPQTDPWLTQTWLDNNLWHQNGSFLPFSPLSQFSFTSFVMEYYQKLWSVVSVAITLPIVDIAAVLLQFYTRKRQRQSIRIDDWLIIPALVSNMSH